MDNKEFAAELKRRRGIEDKRISRAFYAIDRCDFVPQEYKSDAYIDEPIPIGHQVFTSQPSTIAFMLEKAKPERGDKVLEIGTGSGYMTALLAHIVGKKGEVHSIEYIPALTEFARANLKKYNFKNIFLYTGDGKLGIFEEAPFNLIIAAAEADEVYPAWKEQTFVGGRILAPYNSGIIVLHKTGRNRFKREYYPAFRFVPMQ